MNEQTFSFRQTNDILYSDEICLLVFRSMPSEYKRVKRYCSRFGEILHIAVDSMNLVEQLTVYFIVK